MSDPSPFTWRHVEADTLLFAACRDLRDALSDRDGAKLLHDSSVPIDYTTVVRGVQRMEWRLLLGVLVAIALMVWSVIIVPHDDE
jgi:hypothetical protein